MVKPKQNLIQLAKQGNPEALITLINNQLEPKGIKAKGTMKDRCLQVVLEANQVPNQEKLTNFIKNGINKLEVESIEQVKLYGKQKGEEFIAWDCTFELVDTSNSFEFIEDKKNNVSYYPQNISSSSSSITPSSVDVSTEIKQIETWFNAFWISFAIGIPLCVILIGLIGLIVATIFSTMLLHKFWKIIQDGKVRTTPGKAAGYCFIPFFNFYWYFVAYYGLAKDMNRYIHTNNIQTKQINENLVLILCILLVATIIPDIALLTAIGASVVYIIVMKEFKNMAIDILKHKARNL